MDGTEFQRLLHNGHGRAVIYAREHGNSKLRDIILDASLHCHAVDPLVEGTRAYYMLGILKTLADGPSYVDAVIDSLSRCEDDWHANQRFEIAACVAREGNARARRALYENFNPGPRFGDHLAIELIGLDKLKGLLFAAESIGKKIISGTTGFDFGWINFRGREVCGEQEYWNQLQRAGDASPPVQAFYLAVSEYYRKHEMEREDRKRERTDIINTAYADLRDGLVEMKRRDIHAWARKASERDLEAAAKALAEASSDEERLAHLQIFLERPFPLDPGILTGLLSSRFPDLGRFAVRALTKLRHPVVRNLAHQLIATQSEYREDAIALLSRNFQAGDARLALDWFEAEDNRDFLHRMAIDLRATLKEPLDPELRQGILQSLYENDPCSAHREFIVRDLIELNATNDQIRAECLHDANDATRALMQ